jgi:hypothetical protein
MGAMQLVAHSITITCRSCVLCGPHSRLIVPHWFDIAAKSSGKGRAE